MGASALDSRVLVLNRLYMAVHVVSVRRAFALLFKHVAEVVSYQDEQFNTYDFDSWRDLSALRADFDEEDEVVRTVSFDIRVPKIIRLAFYSRMPRTEVKFNRRNIFARDENRCQYCGKRRPTSELSLDHVVPRSRGGKSSWTNIVCACTRCNARKGGRLPNEAAMHLFREPVKPRRSPVLHLTLRSEKYKSWRHFVDEAYWSIPLQE